MDNDTYFRNRQAQEYLDAKQDARERRRDLFQDIWYSFMLITLTATLVISILTF